MGSPAAALAMPNDTQKFDRVTMTGNLVLTAASDSVQSLDTNGSARDVTLPAVTAALAGKVFYISNRGAQTITLKNSAATALATVLTKAAVIAICDGTGWQCYLGAAVTVQG